VKRITAYFFSGILFLAPIAVTTYLQYLGFKKVDQIASYKIPRLGFLLSIAACPASLNEMAKTPDAAGEIAGFWQDLW
jgi:uncharacterized membrane protein